jgi:hypothetical protein
MLYVDKYRPQQLDKLDVHTHLNDLLGTLVSLISIETVYWE